MAHTLAHADRAFLEDRRARTAPAYEAFRLLQVAFIIAPIVAGVDKFFHLLTNWNMYLSPAIANALPISADRLMMLVGGIEILAGLLVALKPRIGGYVVALWLWAIIVNLLMQAGSYDIVLRDFGLSLGALALARLSEEFSS
jgi:hypothetical protein